MDRRSFVFSLLLIIPVFNWWITPPQVRDVRIAASGNLREVLQETSRYYETRNPNVRVKLLFGSSAEIARQLENKAPFDAYIGDEDDIDVLNSKSLLVDGTEKQLFLNQVVAVGGNELDWDVTDPKQLTPDNVKKIALMSETSDLGQSARDYLQKYGVLDAVKDKINDVKNIKGAIEAVKSGEAKWTFVYATDAEKRKSIKILWHTSTEEFPPMIFSIARPVSSEDPEVFNKVVAAMQSSIVRKFFENAGFSLLTPTPDNRVPNKK